MNDDWWPFIIVGVILLIQFLMGDCASSGRSYDDDGFYEPPMGARP